jgi:hypothetical protein
MSPVALVNNEENMIEDWEKPQCYNTPQFA